MIDLHSHTTESDGTFTPARLIDEAVQSGVEVLAITDHDTFAGYDLARPLGAAAGLRMVCGIELSVKLHGQSVHLLGYFPRDSAPENFRAWVLEMQAGRRDRNRRLAARLRELGVDITLEEVQARGRGMTGRPHFAQILVEKGYVLSLQQAFDDYLDESAKGYVFRDEPQFAEAVARIRGAQGVASLAHPIRVKGNLTALLPELSAVGLTAIEAYHSDHTREQTEEYVTLAARLGLLVSGGSDFHGDAKPAIKLGTGREGNLRVPADVWEKLNRALS